jgi:hypothetical protein
MRKFFAILLCIILCLTLIACNKPTNSIIGEWTIVEFFPGNLVDKVDELWKNIEDGSFDREKNTGLISQVEGYSFNFKENGEIVILDEENNLIKGKNTWNKKDKKFNLSFEKFHDMRIVLNKFKDNNRVVFEVYDDLLMPDSDVPFILIFFVRK